MKQRNKKIIAIAIIALVILIGIVVVNIWGFNKELKYKQSQSIDIYVEQEVDNAKMKEIANEVLGEKNIIQTVEVYKDMITIRAESISEEQKNDIVNKIKENYTFTQTAEDTTIKTVPETKIIDMYKKYILPFVISEILILIYMVIRYYKKGILKVLAKTICVPVVGELLLLSIIAITRIPLGKMIPVLVIAVYIGTILYVVRECEK